MFPRLFKSTAFRTAAMAASLFALASTVLMALLYYELTREMLRPIRLEVEQQSADLIKEWKRTGGHNYEEAFQSVMSESVDGNASQRSEVVFAVFNKDGHLMSGNPQIKSTFVGWRQWIPDETDTGVETDQADSVPILAYGTKVDDVSIITGRKLLGLSEAQDIFIRVLSIGLGVICLLALCLGWLMSRTSLRRLDSMVLATRRFANGDLSTRMPITGRGDDIEKLAENVNRMLVQTTDLMGAMKRMSGSLAHEMKSPLTRLRQKLELMTGKTKPTREGLVDALGEMDQVIALFNGLLRITQIEAGERRGKFESVDLSALAKDVVELHRPVAEENSQTIEFNCAPNICVLGDHMLLRQLLSNLVDNAIRHSNGSSIEMRVQTDHGQKFAEIVVADRGLGMSGEEKIKVLQPFHRLERSHGVAGTGLGLATVKAIADIHEANLDLADGHPGLVVTVTFAKS